MSSEHPGILISQIRSRTSALGSAPEPLSLLAPLDGLPAIVARLTSSLADWSPSDAERDRLQQDARESLLQLQRALTYVQARLQQEHRSVLCELKELNVQQEWAERSRQIT